MLAENLLKTGNFEEAETEADKLVNPVVRKQLGLDHESKPDIARAARSVIARSMFAQARFDGSAAMSKSIEALLAATAGITRTTPS